MALDLAKKGTGKVPGRPLVGCVIVDSNNKKIGDGFFSKIGGHHAEAKALKKAGINANGATMYVTLEPHCFQGLTPPCTKAIIKAGIKKIFIAIEDPFPNIRGKGIEELKNAEIEVVVGLKKEEANELNKEWLIKHKN
jgi:diaminohydroxyphosphoribosylaminopyrimidine deaminase/5-amino-6-(5-phosphoribosylamino)uracil reductase